MQQTEDYRRMILEQAVEHLRKRVNLRTAKIEWNQHQNKDKQGLSVGQTEYTLKLSFDPKEASVQDEGASR